MPTQIIIGLGENLAETIDIGNFTNDGQKIRAKNGTSSLNLRFSADNEIILSNDDIALVLAYVALFPTACTIGFNTASGLYLEVNANEIGFKTVALAPFFGMNAAGGGLLNITQQSTSRIFTIMAYADGGADINQNAGTDFLFLNTGLSGVFDSVMKAGVRRSVIISGKGIVAKTNDTTYLNQISFQEPSVLFDCILKSATITADRTITLPNKSGELVVDTYAEKFTQYNATLNATWETIVITDALPNSLIEVVCISTLTGFAGVRQVGRALDRRIRVTTSAFTLTVKTNALKEIQVYATVALNILFRFSAQL